jgi:acyl dehydratase
MPQSPLGPYQIEAFNTATESENKIHDDAVARRFGFKGGLVPGVEVYAYMTHLPVLRWGSTWLEHGTAECRFAKPVYDGDLISVSGTETAEALELRLESRGELCATGRAGLPASPQPVPAAFAQAPVPPDPPAERPPANESTLPVGRWFAIHSLRLSAEDGRNYLRDVREGLPLYAEAGLVHPGMILHIGNWALRHNVSLGPWMHVGSRIDHFAAARIGDELSAKALVTGNYEHKGHRFVALDVLVYANRTTPVARIAHTAIYRPRQLAAV